MAQSQQPERATAYVQVYDVNRPSERDQLQRCRETARSLGYVISPQDEIVDGAGVEPPYTRLDDLRNRVRSLRHNAHDIRTRDECAID